MIEVAETFAKQEKTTPDTWQTSMSTVKGIVMTMLATRNAIVDIMDTVMVIRRSVNV